ncbi:MAG: hypothetical protein K2N43_07805 [Lachnospiraceae bacterium]|nr:hypothetical protein [Lachnospiraceae bacterium]
MKRKKRLYCYAFLDQGIKIYLHGKSGKWYRLRIQIEPCRVLGEKDPAALAKLNKDTYKKLVKTADKLLKKLEIPCSINEMKISRCDLTVNVEFFDQDELTEYLRIFKKSFVPTAYTHVFFKKNDGKVKDYKDANNHSHCISCKSANFLIYDKVAQLKMIDRWDDSLSGKNVLRFEVELTTRDAIKKRLGKSATQTNYKLLSTAAKNCKGVVGWYVKRLQPECEKYVRYEDAVTLVEDAHLSKKTRERMLYLLRKTSDKESLSAALEAMQEKFDLKKGQCKTILKKFRKLGISPITLANKSSFKELPAWTKL